MVGNTHKTPRAASVSYGIQYYGVALVCCSFLIGKWWFGFLYRFFGDTMVVSLNRNYQLGESYCCHIRRRGALPLPDFYYYEQSVF